MHDREKQQGYNTVFTSGVVARKLGSFKLGIKFSAGIQFLSPKSRASCSCKKLAVTAKDHVTSNIIDENEHG